MAKASWCGWPYRGFLKAVYIDPSLTTQWRVIYAVKAEFFVIHTLKFMSIAESMLKFILTLVSCANNDAKVVLCYHHSPMIVLHSVAFVSWTNFTLHHGHVYHFELRFELKLSTCLPVCYNVLEAIIIFKNITRWCLVILEHEPAIALLNLTMPSLAASLSGPPQPINHWVFRWVRMTGTV